MELKAQEDRAAPNRTLQTDHALLITQG